jgi:hypothetical protein
MSHPILISALAENRRRFCPCGTAAQQRYGLCRECRAVAVWRHETEQTRRYGVSSRTCARTLKTRLLAQVASLLQIISKKAESR